MKKFVFPATLICSLAFFASCETPSNKKPADTKAPAVMEEAPGDDEEKGAPAPVTPAPAAKPEGKTEDQKKAKTDNQE